LFDELGIEVKSHSRELTAKNAPALLRNASVVVDSFDNSKSRNVVKGYSLTSSVPCLHVGLNRDYAEVIWNEHYRAPSAANEDMRDYPLARNLILIAVAVASESLVRYLSGGGKGSYTITLGDFAAQQIEPGFGNRNTKM
jgi:molybdopterin/thiamine biosynthesis adenylyltransferase